MVLVGQILVFMRKHEMEKTIFHTAISTFTVVIIFIPIGLITKFLLSLFFGSIFAYWEGDPGFGVGIIDFANDIYVSTFKYLAEIITTLAMTAVPLYLTRVWLKEKLSETNWIVPSIGVFVLVFSLAKYLPSEYGANPYQLSDFLVFVWLALLISFSHWLARKFVLDT